MMLILLIEAFTITFRVKFMHLITTNTCTKKAGLPILYLISLLYRHYRRLFQALPALHYYIIREILIRV